MDPATLAAAAVSTIASYLLKLGGAAAEEGAKSAGKSVLDWIKGKLTSAAGREAVEDIEKAPDAPENADALKTQIVKALKADPEAAAALAKLLAGAPGGMGGQIANVTGSKNNVGLADRGGTVSISRSGG